MALGVYTHTHTHTHTHSRSESETSRAWFKKSKACCGHVPDAINVLVTLLFQLLAKDSSAALPCKRFINKHL